MSIIPTCTRSLFLSSVLLYCGFRAYSFRTPSVALLSFFHFNPRQRLTEENAISPAQQRIAGVAIRALIRETASHQSAYRSFSWHFIYRASCRAMKRVREQLGLLLVSSLKSRTGVSTNSGAIRFAHSTLPFNNSTFTLRLIIPDCLHPLSLFSMNGLVYLDDYHKC